MGERFVLAARISLEGYLEELVFAGIGKGQISPEWDVGWDFPGGDKPQQKCRGGIVASLNYKMKQVLGDHCLQPLPHRQGSSACCPRRCGELVVGSAESQI